MTLKSDIDRPGATTQLTLSTREDGGGERTVAELEPPPDFAAEFRIEGRLGCGAMGAVYRATQLSVDRVVAIKVLLNPDDPDQLARFQREGRVMAELRHPHVVQVYDQGMMGGFPYLVTELVEGGTLRDRLDDGRLPWREALAMAAQLLDGLAACHARDIVHRDLKPANVLLTAAGAPKLCDLGLARHVACDTGLTATDTLIGTPAYMAPEVMSGAEADTRSDVYAMGAIVHEMITGDKLFGGRTLAQIFAAHRHQVPPDLRSRVPEVPPRVAEAVALALSKDPAARPRDAAAFAEALRVPSRPVRAPVARAIPRAAAPVPAARSRALYVALALAAAALVGSRFRPAPGAARSPSNHEPAATGTPPAAPTRDAMSVYRTGARTEAFDLLRAQPIESLDAWSALTLGSLQLDRNDLPAALRAYQRAVTLAPDNYWAQIGLAEVFNRTGHDAEALAAYRAGLRSQGPDQSIASHGVGEILLRMGKFGEARPHLEHAVRGAPHAQDWHNQLVRCLIALGERDAARVHLAKLLRITPESEESWSELESVASPRDYEQALRASADGRPPSARAATRLARVLYARRDPAADAYQARATQAGVHDPETMLEQAKARVAAGRKPEAISIFRDVLKTDPGNVVASCTLADLLVLAGDRGGARAVLDAAVAAKPAHYWPAIQRADLVASAGSLTESLAMLESLAKSHPDQGLTHVRMAEVLDKLGRAAEAFEQHRITLRMAPELANYVALKRLAPEAERADLELAEAKAQPWNIRAQMRAAEVLSMRGDLAGAERMARIGVAASPGEFWVVKGLVEVLTRRKDLPALVAAIEAYLAQHACPANEFQAFAAHLNLLSLFAEAASVGRRGLRAHPGDALLELTLAQSLCRLERFDEAAATIEAQHARAPTAGTCATLGLIRAGQHRPAEAEALLREAVRLAPGERWSHDALAEFLHDRAKPAR